MATDFDCARVPEQPIPRCPGPPGTRAVLGILRGLILTTASSLTLTAALLVPGTRAASAAELSNGGAPVCAQSSPAVWVIVGEAKYRVQGDIEVDGFGGRKTVRLVFDAAPPAHTPFWNVPDGTLVREESIPGMWPSPAVWVIIGGTHYWVPDEIELAALAGRDKVHVVPYGTLSTALPGSKPLSSVPADGTLVRERSDAAVYVIYGGAKFRVPRVEEFNALGYSWADVTVVPNGALTSAPPGYSRLAGVPRDGTWLRERSSPIAYRISGGRKYSFSSPGPCTGVLTPVVPDGALAGIPYGGPADRL